MTEAVENQATENQAAANASAELPADPVTIELDIGASPPEDAAPAGTPLVEAPEGHVVQYSKTGDPGLDMALGFIGKLGIGPDHPAVAAARKGDFAFIKAELAGRGQAAQGWEQYVALAEKSFGDFQTKAQETAAKTKAVVEEAVGGPENWQAIQTWAKANADDDERAQINAMLSAGGMQARAAAILLSNLYSQANVVREPASPTSQNRGNQPRESNGALSPAEYQAELQALIGRVGAHRVGDSAEYQQLQQRRRAFRG